MSSAGHPIGPTKPGDTQLARLIEASLEGNPRARDELLHHACDRLFALTRRMFRNRPGLRRWEQTDDVFQNAMVRLHRALSATEVRSVRHCFNLASVQIRRELIDLGRKHFGQHGIGRNHHTDHQPSDERGGSLQKVEAEPGDVEEWTDFHERVEALPADVRELVGLLYYEGLSHDEAAGILGVSIRHVGTAAGQVGMSGSSVTYGGVVVGRVAGGDSGSNPLVVTFNASATPAIATAVLRNVRFEHLSDAPAGPLGRTLSFRFADGAGGTSAEVLQTITIQPVNDAPVLGGIGGSDVVYSSVVGPARVAAAATVADVDSRTFGGGVLRLAITSGVLSTDRLSILAEGMGAGQIGLSGTKVTWGGVVIGTVGGGTGATPLSVALNAQATSAAVQALIRRIAYSSIAADPASGGSTPSRTLRFSLSDAAASAGGVTATVFKSLTVGP